MMAHNFAVDGIYYKILTDKTNEVAVTFRGSHYNTHDNEYKAVILIPASVTYEGKTYSVTSIGEAAFELNLDEYIDDPDSWLKNDCPF